MKKMKEFFKKNGFYFYGAVIIIAVGLIIFHIGTAQASECHKNCTKTNTVYVEKDDNNEWKYVAGTLGFTCITIPSWQSHIWPLTKALFTLSKPKFKKFDSACW